MSTRTQSEMQNVKLKTMKVIKQTYLPVRLTIYLTTKSAPGGVKQLKLTPV